MNLAAASDIRVGSTLANAAYYGSNKIWSRPGWVETPGLGRLGFWGLNNNGGTLDLTDSSGSNRTLTNHGNVQPGTGKIGGAAEFAAFNFSQRLSTPVPQFQPSQNYAISMWVNVAVFDFFALCAGEVSGSFIVWGNSSELRWNRTQGTLGSQDVIINDFFELDTWMHCVFSCTSTGRRQVFRNNVLVYDSPSFNVDPVAVIFEIDFGSPRFAGGYDFKGRMDAVGFWNRALSAAEVAYLWNNGNGREL